MKKIFNILIACLLVFDSFAQKEKFNTIATQFYAKKNFSGTILVADKGSIVYHKSFGLANRPYKIPVNNQSKFKIASITKTFTATIILQLMEEGKIDLAKTIGFYLPEYKGEARDKATIHQLLTYSSGIENLDQGSEAMYAMQLTTDSIISKYCSGKLVSEPGKQMSYKNADYIILGKIIEKITGKSYENVLTEKILLPLKMNSSGYLHNKDIIPGMVNYYLVDSTRKFYNDDPYWIENFYASGAMYSTAADLYKFDQALFTNKLLKEKTVLLMTTSYPALWGVAYSFWVNEQEFGKVKAKVMDRRGGISGANLAWYHFINTNQTIFVISNSNAVDVVELREKIAIALLN